MKKRIGTVCLLLLLSGCSITKEKNTQENVNARMDEYETYYLEVQTDGHYETESSNFDLSCEMTQVEDGSYRYYVILDNPKVAMYNVLIMCCENNIPYAKADKMMPSFGIFEDRVSLVPGQVNSDDGYVRGISVSGESSEDHVDLKILVRWKDTDGNDRSEYLKKEISYQGGSQ